MDLRLTVETPAGTTRDVLVELEPSTPIRALLEALALESGLRSQTVSVASCRRTGELLHGAAPVGGADLRDGDVLTLELSAADAPTAAHARPPDGSDDEAIGDLVVVGGSLMGTRVALAPGAYVVGRGPGADVVLSDASLSRRHLRVVVGDDGVEVGDLGSSNGTFLDGVALTEPRALRAGDTLEAGRTLLAFEPRDGEAAREPAARDGVVAFNRPPRIVAGRDLPRVSVPAPPSRREARGLPLGAALVPLVIAGVLYAVTKSPVMLVLGAMTPAMALHTWWDSRRRDRRAEGEAQAGFERRLEEAEATVSEERAREARQLREAALRRRRAPRPRAPSLSPRCGSAARATRTSSCCASASPTSARGSRPRSGAAATRRCRRPPRRGSGRTRCCPRCRSPRRPPVSRWWAGPRTSRRSGAGWRSRSPPCTARPTS